MSAPHSPSEATIPQSIIDRFCSTVPVNVTGLAEALGVRVYESDNLPARISGKIVKDPQIGGSEGYAIVVRSSDPYTRRRFTVAHEIAHFVLHRDRIGSLLTDDEMYRSGLGTLEEIEANRMAADILMPRRVLKDYVDAPSPMSASELARRFQVSEQAMRIRLGLL